jgi:hypothetical protein
LNEDGDVCASTRADDGRILASIRRIISEEDKPAEAGGDVLDLQPPPPPVAEVKPAAASCSTPAPKPEPLWRKLRRRCSMSQKVHPAVPRDRRT